MKNTHELTTAGAFARKHDLSLSDMIKLRDQNQLPDGIFLGGRVWFKRSDCARWAEQFSLHGIRTKAMMASGADPRT